MQTLWFAQQYHKRQMPAQTIILGYEEGRVEMETKKKLPLQLISTTGGPTLVHGPTFSGTLFCNYYKLIVSPLFV